MKSNKKPTYQELDKRINDLQSEIKIKSDYKSLFDNASISIWNEDLTLVFDQIEKLRKLGIPNIKIYLEENPEVLFSLIESLKINSVNNATLKLFRAESDQDFLNNIKRTFGDGADKVFIDLIESIWNNKKSFTSEVNYKTLKGDEFTALFSIHIPQTKLEQQSVPVTIQSIQALKDAESAKRETLIKLQQAQEIGHIGSWEWKWETDHAVWSDEMYRIYGVKKDEFDPTSENVSKTILEEDKHKMENAISRIFKGEKVDSFEFKIVRPNNEIRDLSIIGLQVINGTIFGVTQDITNRKKIENKLNEAQTLAKVGSWLFDLSSQKLEWSNETFRIWGFDIKKGTPEYDTMVKRIHPDDLESFNSSITKAIHLGILDDIEFRICLPNGEQKVVRGICQPVLGVNGEVVNLAGTSQDITEQKLFDIELIKAKEKAEESDRLKSAFLANMSHEIRTPMNAIMGFSQLLKEENLNEKKKETYLNHIESAGNRLLNLISDIVDISKIDANQVSLKYEACDLNLLLINLQNQFEISHDNVGCEITTSLGLKGSERIISIDKSRLSQILSNLLENSLKFTKNGKIEFGYIKENSMLKFFVKDNGIGIDPKDHKAIFDRFSQVGNKYSKSESGTGIGLAIVKSLTNLLGGEIWVESEKDTGSNFYFTIPYKQENHEEIKHINAPLGLKTNNEISILIAEDEHLNYAYLEALFEDYEYKLIHARNGKDAIEILQKDNDIDLVLMDIKMPVINGYEATEEIRKTNKIIPIIALTAYAMEKDREKALESGCNDYLTKPLAGIELAKIINKYVKQ